MEFNKMFDNMQENFCNAYDDFSDKLHDVNKKYVSKLKPENGKYGNITQFATEMIPGVAEYNAIKEGDWKGFAIAAGIDVTSIIVGGVTGGSGYAFIKGGKAFAKTGLKGVTKGLAKAELKGATKEIAKRELKETTKEVAKKELKGATKEIAKKELREATKEVAKKELKDTTNKLTKTGLKENLKKSSVEELKKIGQETLENKIEEQFVKKLKPGDKIDITKIPEYIEDIEKKTSRDIPDNQKKLINESLEKENYTKLDSNSIRQHRKDFSRNKKRLIKEWEIHTGQKWPVYTEDLIGEDGRVIKAAGELYDAHHIIELSVGGPNEWWNLHPAKNIIEHQKGIHGKNSIAREIFGG